MKKLFFLAMGALMLASCGPDSVKFEVSNGLDIDRPSESVELCACAFLHQLKVKDPACLAIFDDQGERLPVQVLGLGRSEHVKLLFQADIKANSTRHYEVRKAEPMCFDTKVQATFVPRRKDDISWENDCAIFRMYGPALATDKDEPLISGGTDVWVKRVPELVSQQWYEDEFAGRAVYHVDNGQGLDFYSVGKSLGGGAAAPFAEGKLWLVGNNFKSYEILENGPIRTVFRLDYEAYDVNGQAVSESRIISLDAGSYLNRVAVTYQGGEGSLVMAAGYPFRGFATPAKTKIDKRGIADCADIAYDQELGYAAYAEPEHPVNGVIYLASVVPGSTGISIADGHVINCREARFGEEAVYYSGGAWNKGGFPALADWKAYVEAFALRVANPLIVSLCTEECYR